MPNEDWYNQARAPQKGAPMTSTGAPSPVAPASLLQGEDVPAYPQMDELGSPKGQAYMQYMSARGQEIQAQSESHIQWMDQLSQMVVEHGDNEYIMQTLNNALQLEGMRGQAISKASEEYGQHIQAMHDEDQKFYGPLHEAMAVISSGYQDENGEFKPVEGADEVIKLYEQLPGQHGIDRRQAAAGILQKARTLAQQTLMQRQQAGGGLTPYQQQQIRLSEDRLSETRAEHERAAGRHEASQTRISEASKRNFQKPSSTEVKEINNQRRTLTGLRDLNNSLKSLGFKPGFLTNQADMKSWYAGLNDPQKTAFRAKLGRTLSDYIKDRSGTAASDKEREALEGNMPNSGDTINTLIEKMNNTKFGLVPEKVQQYKTYLDGLTMAQRDVSGFKSNEFDDLAPTAGDSQVAPEGIPAGSALIQRTPDGTEIWQDKNGEQYEVK